MKLPALPMKWIERWMPPKGMRFALVVLFLFLMMIGVDGMILVDGGIKYSTIHLMYIPIILAGIFFSWPGGLIAGLIAGVVAGPYIPLNMLTHEMQETSNWVIRMGFFSLIGSFSGFLTGLLVQYLEEMRWIAHHDLKSELPNHLDLETELSAKLQRNDPPFYLVVIAIVNYDQICDLFGYDATSELIPSLQKEIKRRFPRIPYYAYYHPERLAFIIDQALVRHLDLDENPLVKLLSESLPFKDVQIHLHTAIGYAASNEKENLTADNLIQMAEIALYQARTKHREICLYSDNIETINKDTLLYLGALKDALANHELELYYQPKQNLQTSAIAGAEALIRWNSPTMGFITPNQFIPQAEQTQLIQPLTRFVIESAFKTGAQLTQRGTPLKISINLATKNLSDKKLLPMIKELLDTHQLDPQHIDFEITESAVMDDPETGIRVMKELKDLGFSLSIDDYGTGYASLSYLKKLPIDTLKIDQSFIKDLMTQRISQEIVAATINMAKALNLHTIAEGVENAEIAVLLKTLGCDTIQGYLYSKPLPLAAFLDFVQKSANP